MPHIEVDGKRVEVNEEGFLAHPEEWNESMARLLAKAEEGLEELTPEHWAVVKFIREYYLEKNLAPMVRKMCQATGFPLMKIYDLFPSGPAKGACKVAGLRKTSGKPHSENDLSKWAAATAGTCSFSLPLKYVEDSRGSSAGRL